MRFKAAPEGTSLASKAVITTSVDSRSPDFATLWRSSVGPKSMFKKKKRPFKGRLFRFLRRETYCSDLFCDGRLRLLFFGGLFRGGRGLRGSRRWRRRLRLIVAGHAFLEPTHAFSEAAHQFRNLPAAEQNQHDHQNNQPVDWKFHKASCP